jgi:two-component system sensor histidine kinase KdpD
MTRIESGTLKPHITIVDIADILGPSLKQVGASDKVITQVGENLPGIKCDVSLVVQTLTNIIRNALFYSHDKVEVLVSTVSGHKIQIEVIDKGPGLPKKDPNQVFQKFYREQPNKSGGMGLGLSIAKSFIEIQGGTLAASNSPEGGAVFTITLPAE